MPDPTPPAEHRFRPGQSGNPGGRPRGRSVSARLRDLLEATEVGGKKLPGGKAVADLVAEVILKDALRGDRHALRELLDRTEGRPKQAVEVSGPEGGAVVITVVEAVKPDGVDDRDADDAPAD